MSGPKPTRDQGDLAEMLETLLDRGVVINADIAVSVGDTELLGVKLRAAVASFETAAEYGLEFPGGTDMERVRRAADVENLPGEDESVSEVLLEESETLSSDSPTPAEVGAESNGERTRSEPSESPDSGSTSDE